MEKRDLTRIMRTHEAYGKEGFDSNHEGLYGKEEFDSNHEGLYGKEGFH